MLECDSLLGMAHTHSRRTFLLSAPLAAAAVSPLHALASAGAPSAAAEAGPAGPIQVFTAETMAGMVKEVEASNATKDLITSPEVAKTLTIAMNSEEKKIAKEFEYHAHRDHVFQVLDGETKYELGGTPKNSRQTKPGEWLAPESEGFQTVMLKKGDYLTVPRMTPHKRITEGKVTLLLISSTTPA
jgi:mannose-6-phosphate isomerase-like protein (cupin superfamily)